MRSLSIPTLCTVLCGRAIALFLEVNIRSFAAAEPEHAIDPNSAFCILGDGPPKASWTSLNRQNPNTANVLRLSPRDPSLSLWHRLHGIR